MKKLIFVLVLVSISMLSYAKDNAKGFGFAKEEIKSETVNVSQSDCLYYFNWAMASNTNVIGYIAIDDATGSIILYGETEATERNASELEVKLYQGGALLASNIRTDGGWLVMVDVEVYYYSGYTGQHRAKCSGINYTCTTYL